jgi:gamma-glutamyl hercynylcysteine S-oxide synthase
MMPATYRQALIEQVCFLPFAGLPAAGAGRLSTEELYIPRAPIPHDAESQPQPSSDISEQPSLAELVHTPGARILLTGEPGAGKTTALYHLALDYASSELAANDGQHEATESPLPLLLHARQSGTAHDWTALLALPERLALPFALPPAIEDALKQHPPDELATLKHALHSNGGLILIDGDAIVDAPGGAALRTAIEHLVALHPKHRFVVTCRTQLLDMLLPLDGFDTYSLPPLADQEVETCIARWYPALSQQRSPLAPNALAERIAILQGWLRGDAYLRNLVGNPLALMVCTSICAQGAPQPPDRAIILRHMLECLLSRHHYDSDETSVDVAQFMTLDQQLALLQTLAMAFQAVLGSSAGQVAALPHTHVESLLADLLESQGVERWRAVERIIPRLLATWQRQSLLVQSSPLSYQLPWESLREYLAARALAMRPASRASIQALRDEPHWRAVLPLATHMLASDNAPIVALAFPRLLLSSATSLQPVRDLLLAAECLLEVDERAEVGSTLHDQVREHLLRALSNHAVPLADRIEAGLLLGRLGDPRFAALSPPVTPVAAGAYIFGSPEGYGDEGPQQSVDVPAFAIGTYPVTYQEYARFLASATDYPQPHYWYDRRFDNPSQPVVGVTWEDANAYCRWLTTQLREAHLLSPDLVVRLPLEIEWEKAAAWNSRRRVKRRYPWGDEWSNRRANTAADRGAWLTVPVGCYPDGVSAYGVHDMIGNVWEWMAVEYASYPGAQVPFHEEGNYTLRGSSCASLPTNARCTYRSRLPANYWRYHLGFRIVLARPLPSPSELQLAQRQPLRGKHKKQRTP